MRKLLVLLLASCLLGGCDWFKGKSGDIGPQGLQGDTGDKGDTGDTGDTGTTGDKGDPGQDGQDAILSKLELTGTPTTNPYAVPVSQITNMATQSIITYEEWPIDGWVELPFTISVSTGTIQDTAVVTTGGVVFYTWVADPVLTTSHLASGAALGGNKYRITIFSFR